MNLDVPSVKIFNFESILLSGKVIVIIIYHLYDIHEIKSYIEKRIRFLVFQSIIVYHLNKIEKLII